MRRKPLLLLCVAGLGVGFYLFRPDTLLWGRTVNESFPATSDASDGSALLSGRFHGVAHETSGTATIHRLADGKRVLRLTGFKTSNGPDVRVRLAKAADPMDNDGVKSAGSVEVAPLKGTEGDQNYDLPADLDVSAFHSVVIWCNRFGVNFGTAPLTAN
ncbi:MAG TPA: DM13 domain-containing protein [Planctomycetota bacterium]|nr:DM13 domain-containing protein [Planctomycetota bacterium]